MGMVVRTNTMSTNAYRQLGMNSGAVSKSLEKLSSGFRINRAGDDASGLAISEKMKAQINGLEQASANSQDGISLIQTAEGATTEIHNMLNRMVTLATKSSNGTIQDEVDREAIQTEVDALNTEITRIAKSTNFNGINLLDGNLSAKGAAGAAGVPTFSAEGKSIETVEATKAVDTLTAPGAAITGAANTKYTYTINYTDADGNKKSSAVSFSVKTAGTAGAAGVLVAADGTEYTETDTAAAGFDAAELQALIGKELMKDKQFASTFKANAAGTGFTAVTAGKNTKIDSYILAATTGDTGTPTLGTVTHTTAGADSYQKLTGVNQGDVFTIDGKKFAVFESAATAQAAKDALTGDNVGKYDDVNFIYSATAGTGALATADSAEIAAGIKLVTGYDGASVGTAGEISFKAPTGTTATKTAGGLTLQVGDTNADFNHVTVMVDDLTAKGIGTEGLDVSGQKEAAASIQTIKSAINKVSTNRGNLGALQNRLEYTINNLDTTNENMTAANSRIRDTDMAKEMMNYTKMNILTQAAQAMLAQANQQPQSILQLLQ